MKFIAEIKENNSHMLSIETLATTISCIKVPLLTITNLYQGKSRLKDHVIITARVHPGESFSSYAVEGFIRFLLSDDPQAV